MQNDVPYAEANAIKYLMRWRYKHPDKEGQIQDLLKAKQYIDLLIEKETHEDVMQLRFRFGDKDE
jgi:hypothetical protein